MDSKKTIRRMSYTKWVKSYCPIKNPFDSLAGIDGYLFRSFGKEWEFVSTYDNAQIWTLVIMDLTRSAAWEITNGIHVVNREGLLITQKPVLENSTIHIRY